ncbi:alpha/beta hydrolase family protein [Mucilaginibacter sp. UR6-11]|uniref:alpha/beta hydrolase n=1 Tax=Mucilaginibacter sp. UR6-11 TaxID=1435644 RepID=UPI001E3F9173|nr:alpha/beta hydrolase family protein [Mucilaginibacter sp. UR6-11]MCC8426437.1 esterase family protein [Mucilaginibacter sp. UR6-11]
MKKNLLAIAFLLLAVTFVKAAKVDTVETYSNAMHKKIKALVITPADYEQGKAYPVVYLLHGAGGNYKQFYGLNPGIAIWADIYHLMIVCADGGITSWYFDSPIDPNFKYETYVTKELIGYIDKNYKTIKNKTGRAISGLSMGGHGAMYLAIRHQDLFGAVGSMSGGVDIRPFPDNWDMAKRLGKYNEYPENWEKNTVTNMLYLITPKSLAITFDCGVDDFFFKVNTELHEKMLERNIPHDFTARPGAHTSQYWANSVQYHLLFFNNYFRKANPELNN